MTLSNAYSWSPVGQRVYVPYEAPQGRRVNAVGALFQQSRRFVFATLARVPVPKRKAVSPLAAGLAESELGVLNAQFLMDFIWQIAGRQTYGTTSETRSVRMSTGRTRRVQRSNSGRRYNQNRTRSRRSRAVRAMG